MGTYGSRSLAVGGTAIVKACDKIIDKGKKVAAHMLEAKPENVDFIEEVGTVDEPNVEKIADEVIEAPTESALAVNIPKNISSSVASSSSYLTIQVSASPTIERAEAVADTLEDLGFDVYIQRGYQGENEAVWYRVRVGTFSTMTEARNASDAIRSITDYDTWIDRVRKDL